MIPGSLNRRQFSAGVAAAGLALSSATSAEPAGEAAPARRGYQSGRFGQVHYRFVQPGTASGKPPLLCLHASPGSGLNYAAFLALAGRDRLAIAADTPGYGLSDRPPTPSTIIDFAGAMSDLVDGLGLTQIDLLGNHTSSATAIALARQRPGLVRKIVLNSALMFTPQDRAEFRANIAKNLSPDLETAVAGLPDRWRTFRRFRSDLSEEGAWALFWEVSRDPMHANWGYEASFNYDFAETLAQIRQPTLILNPKDVLFEITSRARGVAPNIAVLDLPWTGGTFTTHVAEVATLAQDFLDG